MSGVKLIAGGKRFGRVMTFIEGFETQKNKNALLLYQEIQ